MSHLARMQTLPCLKVPLKSKTFLEQRLKMVYYKLELYNRSLLIKSSKSLTILGPLWFIFISLVFFYLSKLLVFLVSFNLKVIFVCVQQNLN